MRKYALIGMLDVDLFYEEVPEQIEETSDDKGVTVYTSTPASHCRGALRAASLWHIAHAIRR